MNSQARATRIQPARAFQASRSRPQRNADAELLRWTPLRQDLRVKRNGEVLVTDDCRIVEVTFFNDKGHVIPLAEQPAYRMTKNLDMAPVALGDLVRGDDEVFLEMPDECGAYLAPRVIAEIVETAESV